MLPVLPRRLAQDLPTTYSTRVSVSLKAFLSESTRITSVTLSRIAEVSRLLHPVGLGPLSQCPSRGSYSGAFLSLFFKFSKKKKKLFSKVFFLFQERKASPIAPTDYRHGEPLPRRLANQPQSDSKALPAAIREPFWAKTRSRMFWPIG